MKKLLPLLTVTLLALTASAQASTIDVVLGSSSNAATYNSSPVSLDPNIDLLNLPISYAQSNAAILSETISIPGYFTVPTGSLYGGTYLAVLAGGSSTFSLGPNATGFGFTWGSVDPYNELILTDSRGVSYTITGTDILNNIALSGATSQADILFTDPFGKIVTAELLSSANAFEAGNFGSQSAVPLPTSLVLFMMALAGLAFVAQRQRKSM